MENLLKGSVYWDKILLFIRIVNSECDEEIPLKLQNIVKVFDDDIFNGKDK